MKREALAQMLSCEFCEISKNTFLHNRILLGDCFCHYKKEEPFTTEYLPH